MKHINFKGGFFIYVKLTIPERLKDLRVERHLTLEELAEQTGLSRAALGNYENNDDKDISHYSIQKLADFYGVSTDYLLCRTDIKKHATSTLAELNLSDDMIGLLRSGRVNNRLLCEIVTHPRFPQLMEDMEIYVDGIAAMQIQNLNAYVDVVRTMLKEKVNPNTDDHYMQTLDAMHIDAGRYFFPLIHDSLDEVLHSIREAHKDDTLSAPTTSALDSLKKDMDAVASFEGSYFEKLAFSFCQANKISYKKLTQEEKYWLVKILQKSKLVKSGAPRRGKKH